MSKPTSNPDHAWLDALLSDSRAVVTTLVEEPLVPLELLADQVQAYKVEIDNAGPQADHVVGTLLAERSLELLRRVTATGDGFQARLAQVAVRYFVLDDDGDEDLMSPFGFDDDVEVFNAVVEHLGMSDLAIGHV